eukprot:TRINITY_DN10815_c0_g1_i1.p1 TRINITY_DN10815_c0_g1~~TRINITY_DN10815_c0_g1_i1.p1  ORF type:complete len:336 (-),score=67.13 TRINITY_DN10815_c0_g1_i1:10-1017(-)
MGRSKRKRGVIKPFHNIRTHQNPLSDNRFLWTPYAPQEMDWSLLYPCYFDRTATGTSTPPSSYRVPPPAMAALTTYDFELEQERQRDRELKKLQQDTDESPTNTSTTRTDVDVSNSTEETDDAVSNSVSKSEVVIGEATRIHSCTTPSRVEFADVGCGFGGLSISLAKLFPDVLVLAMEIRGKAVEYVKERINKERIQNDALHNVAVLQTNAMKYLPNFFVKGQLTKLFFLFPDPHFKRSNHKRRIISPALLAEYAYLLCDGGLLYTCTDVKDLYDWMDTHIDAHPLFEKLSQEELDADPVVPLVLQSSEEAQKVARANGDKHLAVFRRVVVKRD